MKSKILFFFLFFPFSCSFAQQIFIDVDENSQNRIMATEVKECDYYVNLNVDKTSLIKNDNQIPAFGLYQNFWDTLFIRSETIEIPFFNNQLKIILIQDDNTPFAFPISGNISITYVKNKQKQHAGIDFSIQKKEPVVACFDGVVRIAKKYEEYGNTVVLRHYNGLETLYAQLDNVCVVTNQKVKAGDLIGYIGNVEEKRKNALHFETRFLNEFFNPEKVVNFSERKLQSSILTITPNDFLNIPLINPHQTKNQETTKTIEDASSEQLLNTPKAMPVFHTVVSGETIYKICSKYNITERELRSLNNINGNHIEVGQKLRVK
jgi:murein DD-endopeptidase MepM/ murein hydrolase activator NlpD